MDLHISLGHIVVTVAAAFLSYIGKQLLRRFEELDSYFEKTDVAYRVAVKNFPADVGIMSADVLRAKQKGAGA